MKKFIKIFLVLFGVLICIGIYVLTKHILPYAIIQPPRISEKITPIDLGLKSTDLNITVEDSIDLKGYWVKSNLNTPKSLIVMVHGIGGCKEHFLPLAKNLASLGIESVLMDSRAHGKSEGMYCTYGFKEKKDLSNVVDYIKTKNDTISIGIWGNSMGGAIAIQAMELDKRIQFGIIESTFTHLNQIVYDYQKSHTYGIGLKLLSNSALNEAGKIADFDPSMVSPITSVTNIKQPILIAHGDADKNIKFEYGKLLYSQAVSKNKKFIAVKNGGHFNLAETAGKEYQDSILHFISRYAQDSL